MSRQFLTIVVIVLVVFLVLRTFNGATLNLQQGATSSGDTY